MILQGDFRNLAKIQEPRPIMEEGGFRLQTRRKVRLLFPCRVVDVFPFTLAEGQFGRVDFCYQVCVGSLGGPTPSTDERKLLKTAISVTPRRMPIRAQNYESRL
jgi:hypothetical protein